MNRVSKIFFWIFTIALGFVNPLISFALIVLYYLPGIIQSICNPCSENCSDQNNRDEENWEIWKDYVDNSSDYSEKMDSFSDDTLEKMR